MTNLYYRDANAAILTYDITNEQSFTSLDFWLKELKYKIDNEGMILCLAGNKCDVGDDERKVEYNRSDESEAELCHFGIMFHCFGIFTHGKSPPSYVFYIIIGETSGNHPMVVWSEDGNIRSEDSLMIPCIFG